ncbi:acyltransferase family protein [Salipaludibacillus agaradhaerens]|uniref:Acyltransferase family protein n=1 Tax=Salipaludibacillus agaradhaerens TaxID=76935 RepID=A0A9Q4B4U6_SALAG|nr:acyltransferase family protein [Salipaludibacillus agaradhaerens]MCR6098005.1 acyltransferase family protein [Salipaludibacillus agaradhaerens]MCR6116366.1 acyltransferase family protein [Salipaludibacillus agaradhaerens]
MGRSNVIKEIYWLRAIACLAVVLTHSITTTLSHYVDTMSQAEEYLLIALRFIFLFGTPTFVFISEFLLSYSYANGVPKGFFVKRIKFLLVPFIFMGVVFATITREIGGSFINQVALNLFMGGYTGYFVLVIFQFYLLHMLMEKRLKVWSPRLVLVGSFVINVAYLSFFHFTTPPASGLGEYFWQRGHWLPVFGWLFYFTVGYYSGKHYRTIIEKLKPYKQYVYVLPFLITVPIFGLVRTDILSVVSSKRIDYVLFTTAVIAFILLLASQVNKTPSLILIISKYSFNIYLLHTVFLHFMPQINLIHPFLYLIIATVACIGLSILVVKLTSILPFRSYLFGKTLPVPLNTRSPLDWRKQEQVSGPLNYLNALKRSVWNPRR